MKVSFSDLTDKEVEKLRFHEVLNGMGPNNLPALVFLLNKITPNWLTSASPDHHDFNYLRGGNEIDRYKADLNFYLLMANDARKDNPPYILFLLRRIFSFFYFKAVREFGYKFFYYGEYRTKEELLEMCFKHDTSS